MLKFSKLNTGRVAAGENVVHVEIDTFAQVDDRLAAPLNGRHPLSDAPERIQRLAGLKHALRRSVVGHEPVCRIDGDGIPRIVGGLSPGIPVARLRFVARRPQMTAASDRRNCRLPRSTSAGSE
jgi:hypothetical protein